MKKDSDIKKRLMANGVTLVNPESIEIGSDVNPERVSSKGVIIYSGTKIFGKNTLILPGSVIGLEGPATIDNCYVGPHVKLGGGYFKDSVFLGKVTIASCAHVREGCILEEESKIAHSVGLKQTILFPYVTLGSLINFCDCFMAGGTGKKDHSEVGSSYIHFNFTPQQDKATPSLIGDVPNGVMLDQRPIFLGGQGGMVGPCRLGFGITVAAGTICRQDELRPNRLIFGGAGKGGNIGYSPRGYRNIARIFINNVIYLGNLNALYRWYTDVRSQFIGDDFPVPLFEGLQSVLASAIEERIKRLNEFVVKLRDYGEDDVKIINNPAESYIHKHQKDLINQWGNIEEIIRSSHDSSGDKKTRDYFLSGVKKEIEKTGRIYIDVIKHLQPEIKRDGTLWLQGILDELAYKVTAIVQSLSGLG